MANLSGRLIGGKYELVSICGKGGMARQKRAAKLGPLEKVVSSLEDRIATLQAEQKVRSAELADPSMYDDAARRNKLLRDYQRWEKAMAELDAARAELAAGQKQIETS